MSDSLRLLSSINQTMIPELETFTWGYYKFNISRINRDLASGLLGGISVQMDRQAIEWFFESILCPKDSTARLFPQVSTIDTIYAEHLAPPRADHPIAFGQLKRFSEDVGLGAGLDVCGALCYDATNGQIVVPTDLSTADVVLIDGNHRIAAAYYQRRSSMKGTFLSYSQLHRYQCN